MLSGAAAGLAEHLLAPGWESLHPYRKWQGAHWRLLSLVELGEGRDPRAHDLLDHVLAWAAGPPRLSRVNVIEGRARRCASQEGNALFVAVKLGESSAGAALAARLVDWQWPDGGWNCDIRPQATHSSFHETIWPLRGLAAYADAVGDRSARTAAHRAGAFLLRHRLFRSERTGAVIDDQWLHIHWPPYWHYDVLQGLRAVAAAGQLASPETADALAWLEARRNGEGTWATSGRRYWRPPGSRGSGVEVVDWTHVGDRVVTEQAVAVLAGAGQALPTRAPSPRA